MTDAAVTKVVIKPGLNSYILIVVLLGLFITLLVITSRYRETTGESPVQFIVSLLVIAFFLIKMSLNSRIIEFNGDPFFNSINVKTLLSRKTYSLDHIRIAILWKAPFGEQERLIIIPSEVNDEKLKPTLPTRREMRKMIQLVSSSVSYPAWSAIVNSIRPKIKEMSTGEINAYFKEVKNSAA